MSDTQCNQSSPETESVTPLAAHPARGGRSGFDTGPQLCLPGGNRLRVRKHAAALRPTAPTVKEIAARIQPEHDAWRTESLRKRNARAAAILGGAA